MTTADTPLRERFLAALYRGDAETVRALLETHDEVRALVNAPIGSFGSRPVAIARDHLPVVDVLLAQGADINLKSDWWAGPFGVLEWNMTPERAAPLIERGAVVDIFAAAHLGMLDRVKAIVEADPSQVRSRGGDGKTALHCATTVAIAEYLLAKGADIDARDVDHESTPAQHLVRDAPDVARMLVERGAWFDIFIAVALNDPALVERSLRADPEALDHRIWHGKYTSVHKGGRASTREEIGDHRGDIYRWVFDHNVSVLDVAASIASPEIHGMLWQHATPPQRLLAACARGDRQAATEVIAAHPGVIASLTLDQRKLIVDRAHANDTAAVLLMLDLGFDPLVKGVDDWEAIRWAAFHGNVEMATRLIQHSPPLNVPDPSYGGTILGQCLYGSVHGWHCRTGRFAATAQLLLDAGEIPKADWYPTGREDVDAVLKAWFDAHAAK